MKDKKFKRNVIHIRIKQWILAKFVFTLPKITNWMIWVDLVEPKKTMKSLEILNQIHFIAQMNKICNQTNQPVDL